MNLHSKAKLVDAIQKWLDDEQVQDDLVGTDGIWQCDKINQRNANLYADAVELAIRSMALQAALEDEQEL